jgi:hypothetical protein
MEKRVWWYYLALSGHGSSGIRDLICIEAKWIYRLKGIRILEFRGKV